MIFVFFSFCFSSNVIEYDETNKFLSITADSPYTRQQIDEVIKDNIVESVKIEGSYDEIPEFAFAHMKALKNIVIKSQITKINNFAFLICSAMTDFTVPEGCQYIGISAFQDGFSLETFYYRKCTMTVDASAFRRCLNLKTFKLDENDKSSPIEGMKRTFGAAAFRDCHKLRDFQILDDVTELSEYMFYKTQVNLDVLANVVKIGKYCFSNSGIQKLILPNIKVIGVHAFSYCNSLVSIEFSAGLVEIQAYAFYKSPNVNFHDLNQIKFTFESYSFAYVNTITEITIPSSMYHIPAGAFYNCQNLQKVIYNDHILQIWELAFFNTSQQDIRLPDILMWAAPGSFVEIKNAMKFDVGQNTYYTTTHSGKVLTRLDNSMTFCATNLDKEEVVDVSKYTIIGPYSFYRSQVVQVATGPTTNVVCSFAFAGNEKLSSFVFSGDNLVLQQSVFENCINLQTFVAHGIKSINNRVFYNCQSIKNLEIENVESIFDSAFYNCANLNFDFTKTPKLSYIGVKAFDGYNFHDLNLPVSLLDVAPYAFSNSRKLRNVVVNSKINLRPYSFYKCPNINSFTFMQNADTISDSVLDSLLNLKNLIYCGDEEPKGKIRLLDFVKVYTSNLFKGSKFMGYDIYYKLSNCPVLPPSPSPQPTEVPTLSPTEKPPTSQPSDNPSDSKMKKVVLVESIVGGILILVLVIVVLVLCLTRRMTKDSLNSTPLLSQQ